MCLHDKVSMPMRGCSERETRNRQQRILESFGADIYKSLINF